MPLPFMVGMMTAGSPAALPSAITLGATLNATASASSVTSAAVVVTVPAGNSGLIVFQNLVVLGAGGNLRWRRNSGVYTTISGLGGDGDTFADTNTITLSVNGCAGVGDGASIDLVDQSTGTKIATASLYRV